MRSIAVLHSVIEAFKFIKTMVEIEIYDYWRPSLREKVSIEKIGRKYIYAGGRRFLKKSGEECADPMNYCITEPSFERLKKALAST